MRKSISLLLVCFIAPIMLFAQTKLSPNQILDATSQKIYSAKGIHATFATTVHQGTSSEHVLDGTFDILATKYLIQTTAACTWFNGKELWNHIIGSDEVTLVTPTPEEIISSSPLAFLNIYQKGYNLVSKNVTINGKKAWEITMRAQDKKLEPSIVIVNVNQSTYEPMKLRVRHNGDWTQIDIKTYKVGVNFSPDHFNFPAKDYPKCEVIDMR